MQDIGKISSLQKILIKCHWLQIGSLYFRMDLVHVFKDEKSCKFLEEIWRNIFQMFISISIIFISICIIDLKMNKIIFGVFLKYMTIGIFNLQCVLQGGALDLLKELKNIPMTLELLQVWFFFLVCKYWSWLCCKHRDGEANIHQCDISDSVQRESDLSDLHFKHQCYKCIDKEKYFWLWLLE